MKKEKLSEEMQEFIEQKVDEKVEEREKEKGLREKITEKYFSRRSFLKMLGAGLSGLALSSAASANWMNLEKQASSSLPSDTITLWSGTTSDVPSGWVLCDGNNGTPNLQDRFVVGAGSSYSADNTGGSSTVTISSSQMPSHSHGGSTGTDGSHSHGIPVGTGGSGQSFSLTSNYASSSYDTNSAGDHSHTIDDNSTGGDSSHENKPPYYALAYIMKT